MILKDARHVFYNFYISESCEYFEITNECHFRKYLLCCEHIFLKVLILYNIVVSERHDCFNFKSNIILTDENVFTLVPKLTRVSQQNSRMYNHSELSRGALNRRLDPTAETLLNVFFRCLATDFARLCDSLKLLNGKKGRCIGGICTLL